MFHFPWEASPLCQREVTQTKEPNLTITDKTYDVKSQIVQPSECIVV